MDEVTRPGLGPNETGTCIDNIVTNIDSVRYLSNVLHTLLSDHNGIIFRANLSKDTVKSVAQNNASQTSINRIVNSNNVSLFLKLIHSINWIDVYSLDCVNEKFTKFFHLYLWAVNCAFPFVKKKSFKFKSNNKWYSTSLSKLKDKCDKLYSLNKIYNLPYLKESYKNLKKLYKYRVKEAKIAYNSNLINKAKNKSKATWDIVNSLTNINCKSNLSNDIPSENFNNFFIDNVKELSSNIPSSQSDSIYYLNRVSTQNKVPAKHFGFREVTVEEVFKAINKLSNSNCLDIYGLNSSMLKVSASYISEVLAYLFNNCITNKCSFPSELKKVKVIPIHKKGPKNIISNFRPISIVPVFSKLFESLLHSQLSDYLEKNQVFTNRQYGFRPKHSTTDAVLDLVDNVVADLEKGSVVSFSSFDMSKAFDTVQHDLLCKKLAYYGVDQISVSLIESYLKDRLQYVFKNGNYSSSKYITQGVPQGSILGPVLFNVYINDLPTNVNSIGSDIYLFADDVGLKLSLNSLLQVKNTLKYSSEMLEDWCFANKLCLNQSKTCDISFSLNCKNEDKTKLKFLGIYLDSSLNWFEHVNYIASKLSKGLFLLRRLRESVDANALLKVYYGHVHSLLSYGIAAWGNCSHSVKLFILQKRAVRIICNVPWKTHCKPLFKELGILTLPSIYILTLLVYTHGNNSKFSVNSDTHNYNTRNKNNLRIQFCNYSLTQKNWRHTATKLYNNLPKSIKSLPLQLFKNKVKYILKSECLYEVKEFFCVNFSKYS